MNLVLVAFALPAMGWISTATMLRWYGLRRSQAAHATKALRSGEVSHVVVAGAIVYENGQISPALERRIHKALALISGVQGAQIVFTGGRATTNRPSEARAALQYAMNQGLEKRHTLLEELSFNTLGNAEHSFNLIGDTPIIVVSDDYHIYRCERIFREHFTAVIGVGCAPPPLSALKLSLREVMALIKLSVRRK